MHFEEFGDAIAVAVDRGIGVAAGFDAVGDAVVVGVEIQVVGNTVAVRVAAAFDRIGDAVAVAVKRGGRGQRDSCSWAGSACP